MFGLGFSELVMVAIVALLALGPKDLPKTLRKLGQYAGKLRRAAADLRAQSGIDEVLRADGVADDINEIRKLARGEIGSVRAAVEITKPSEAAESPSTMSYEPPPDVDLALEREYPRHGPDDYGALPDTALVYPENLLPSALADDALYVAAGADPSPETET